MEIQEPASFTAHHLRFEVQARTPLLLPAYAGPSIRGALFGALRRHFCPGAASELESAEHNTFCPVCWLMATEKPENQRGRDVPRPYTVEPPLLREGYGERPWRCEPGDRFAFGLTLFAQALHLYPYLVLALPLMGQAGMGIPVYDDERGGRGRRGQFRLCRIDALNPLTGETQMVLAEGETTVRLPEVAVTEGVVGAMTAALLVELAEGASLELWFRTPTRIIEAKRLVRRPWLGPLVRRLLERLDALRGAYAGLPPWPERERLEALADQVRLVEDETAWIELRSGSRRQQRSTPVSGYVGRATYMADPDTWRALLPVLLWGEVAHVGKNTTKGEGWYEVLVGG